MLGPRVGGWTRWKEGQDAPAHIGDIGPVSFLLERPDSLGSHTKCAAEGLAQQPASEVLAILDHHRSDAVADSGPSGDEVRAGRVARLGEVCRGSASCRIVTNVGAQLDHDRAHSRNSCAGRELIAAAESRTQLLG